MYDHHGAWLTSRWVSTILGTRVSKRDGCRGCKEIRQCYWMFTKQRFAAASCCLTAALMSVYACRHAMHKLVSKINLNNSVMYRSLNGKSTRHQSELCWWLHINKPTGLTHWKATIQLWWVIHAFSLFPSTCPHSLSPFCFFPPPSSLPSTKHDLASLFCIVVILPGHSRGQQRKTVGWSSKQQKWINKIMNWYLIQGAEEDITSYSHIPFSPESVSITFIQEMHF